MHPMQLHLLRAFRCDFTRYGATDAERAVLAAAPEPVTAPHVQDYLAWRRSMAWVALGPVALSAVLTLVGWIDDTSGEGVPSTFHFLYSLLLGASLWLLAAVGTAIRRWKEPDLVRRRLRVGWLAHFLAPILVCLVPWIDVLLQGHEVARPSEENPQAVVQWLQVGVLRLGFGIQVLLWLAPVFLAIFPGVTRAGITVKTLLPGRSTAVNIAGMMAPIYGAAFLIAGAVIQQLGGNAMLAIGMIVFLLGPLSLSRRAFALSRPMSREELAPLVRSGRARAGLLVGLGGLLMFIALFGVEILGTPLVGFSGRRILGPLDLLEKVVVYVGSLTVFTVVAADALLESMVTADRRRRGWATNDHFLRDGDRLDDLAKTIDRRKEDPPPPTP